MNDYSGVTLTPNKFAELLVELFDGKQFSRQDAIEQVKQCFTDRGGVVEEKTYAPVFKKASEKLQDRGHMENKAYGIWVINYKKQEVEVILPHKELQKNYVADTEIGRGKQAVYVYYYDAYKKIAESNNCPRWECKIGRTDRDPIQRIFSQAGTCLPESPHLALIIYCDDSGKLEDALHSILRYQKRWIENAPGNEWFLTSPAEIENIYNKLINDN